MNPSEPNLPSTDLSQELAELRNQLAQAEDRIRRYEECIYMLEERQEHPQVVPLQEKVRSLNALVEAYKAQMEREQLRVDELTALLRIRQKKIDDLMSQVHADPSGQEQALHERLDKATLEIQALTAHANQRVARLEADLASRPDPVDLDRARETQRRLEAQAGELTAQVQRVQSELDAARTLGEEREHRLEVLRTQFGDLEARRAEERKEREANPALEARVQELTAELERARGESARTVETLQEKIVCQQQTIQNWLAEQSKLTDTQIVRLTENQEAVVAQLRKEAEALRKELEEKRVESAQHRADASRLRTELEAIQIQLRERDEAVRALGSEREQFHARMEEQLAALRRERDREREEMSARIVQMSAQLREQAGQLAESRAEAETLRAARRPSPKPGAPERPSSPTATTILKVVKEDRREFEQKMRQLAKKAEGATKETTRLVKPPDTERRGRARFTLDDLQVELVKTGFWPSRRNVATAVGDVSETGLRAKLNQNLEPGSTVRFKVRVEKLGYEIQGEALVAWVRELPEEQAWEGGVEFKNLDSATRARIKHLRSLCGLEAGVRP